ncbi:MAG: hypothetical protein ACFCUQ_17910 [Kiloniellales bacterium]
MACHICGGSGVYEASGHESGYFVVETYRCPCRGGSRLLERTSFQQASGISVLAGFALLALIAVQLL